MNVVHVVVPDNIDDPAQPSGGNVYDRRVCEGLTRLGWSVHECPVPGRWPEPSRTERLEFRRTIDAIPDRSTVLVDGLVASNAPDVLVRESRRLRVVPLVHLPLGHRPVGRVTDARQGERAVLSAATDVITTSQWTRARLVQLYDLPIERIHVAEPAVDAFGITERSDSGHRMLCVAAVIRDKGIDLLLAALATMTDLTWSCLCVGNLRREPQYVKQLRRYAHAHGIAERVRFCGPLTGSDLDREFADADLLVSASRAETYGMVVAEALARGVPVVAADVGGLGEALGRTSNGGRPGLLIPPNDPQALARALRDWLTEPDLREGLREGARQRRASLHDWSITSATVAAVLTGRWS